MSNTSNWLFSELSACGAICVKMINKQNLQCAWHVLTCHARWHWVKKWNEKAVRKITQSAKEKIDWY